MDSMLRTYIMKVVCVCRWECVRRTEIRKYIQRGMMDEIKFWFFLDDNSV